MKKGKGRKKNQDKYVNKNWDFFFHSFHLIFRNGNIYTHILVDLYCDSPVCP